MNENSHQAASGLQELAALRVERDAAIRAAQDAVYNTTRLTRLLAILSEPAPLSVLLDRLLATLSELFSADIVVLLDPGGTGSFIPLASIGLPEDLAQTRFSEAEDGYVSIALRRGAPVLVPNARTDLKIDQQLRELDIETAVWLPVQGKYSARGVLIVARCHQSPFARTDVDLLTVMTKRICLVLEQAQYSIQIERIAQTRKGSGNHLDQATICSETAQRFPSIVGADAAALVLLINAEIEECSVTLAGIDPERAPAWHNLARHLLEENYLSRGEPINLAIQERVGDLTIEDILGDCSIHMLLAVPIIVETQQVGFLFATRYSSMPFDPDTLQIALLYASQASAALENAMLYREVREELVVRKQAEHALRARDERFSALIRSVLDVIAILDADGIIHYASPAAKEMWGCPAETLQGQSIFDRIHADDKSVIHKLLSAVQEQPNITLNGVVRFYQNINEWRTFEVIMTNLLDEPAVAGIVSTYHDITERKNHEQELTNLAYRDMLTGLANRTFFIEVLRDALEKANSRSQSVAVIFFDLDNFKIVNDSLGHDKGDAVLKIVAERVRACLRKEDTASRFGGDEFTVLVEHVTSIEPIISVAQRIIHALQAPIDLTDREVYVGCSLGIAISSPNEDEPENLLRKADLAMYQAKGSVKGSYVIFNNNMNVQVIQRLELETELRWALQRKEFRVYYQPVLSLDEQKVIGLETLIRWQHPTRGLISPAEFIPLAEETGLIVEIGQWVLEEACRQICSWKREVPGMASLIISVNLSMLQFHKTEFVSDISQVIRDADLDPSSLILEIAASSLFQDPDAVINKLHALKDIGVRLAMDNFGTGHASLNYLKLLPIDALKIDRSFVHNIVVDAREKAIVRSMVDLAAAFGIDVLGEGVETEEQATQLLMLGCKQAQGNLFSPPLQADSVVSYFRAKNTKA